MRGRPLLIAAGLFTVLVGGGAFAQSRAPTKTTPPVSPPAPTYHQLGPPSAGTAPKSGAAPAPSTPSAAERTARARCMNLADAAARQRCVTGHAAGNATVPATPQ